MKNNRFGTMDLANLILGVFVTVLSGLVWGRKLAPTNSSM